jgi:hypothetical protein
MQGAVTNATIRELARLLEIMASKGPAGLTKEELSLLKARRPAESRDAIWQFEQSVNVTRISPSVAIPRGVEPVDWLLSQKPEYANLPIAKWEGRYSCDILIKLAKLHALCPDVCNDPLAIEWGFSGRPGLTDYILKGAQWGLSPTQEPILSLKDVDRCGSMFGGFPWTCEAFPWPTGDGGHMSPLVQLNLRALCLEKIADFPDILIQVWGNGYDPYLRAIPCSEISNRDPDTDYFEYRNDFLYFERVPDLSQEIACVGQNLSADQPEFYVVGGHAEMYLLDRGLTEAYVARLGSVMAARVDLDLASLIKTVSQTVTDRGDPCGFGGWGSSPQSGYLYWEEGLCLLKYYSDEFGVGLHCMLGGELTIQFDPTDLEGGYSVEVSRFG